MRGRSNRRSVSADVVCRAEPADVLHEDLTRNGPEHSWPAPALMLRALEGRLACLLDHHGMIAIGKTLDKAMWLAVEVETLARQYHGCLQIGKPPLLPSEEIATAPTRSTGRCSQCA